MARIIIKSPGWRRAAWFAALYVASILVFGGVLGLLELCLPK